MKLLLNVTWKMQFCFHPIEFFGNNVSTRTFWQIDAERRHLIRIQHSILHFSQGVNKYLTYMCKDKNLKRERWACECVSMLNLINALQSFTPFFSRNKIIFYYLTWLHSPSTSLVALNSSKVVLFYKTQDISHKQIFLA